MMLAWLLFSAVVAVSSAGTVCGCQVVKEKLSNVLSANRNPGSLSPARRLHLGDEVLIVRITHVLPATPTTFVYDGTVTKVLYSANYETATGVKKIHQMHTDGGQKCFGSNLALPLGTYVMWGQFSHDKTIFYMDPCFIHGKDALLENFVKPLDDAKPFPELEATGGMPQSHIDAFQLTADTSNTVIITRGLNPLSAGLIEEGYAPKGFMNKAKSCNWGPMSGFVLNDPRMGKIPATLTGDARATAIAKQRAAIAKALDMDHFSLLVPVCVSTSRLDQLIRNKLVIVVRRDPDRVDVIAKQKGGELFHFALVKRRGLVGATGELWVVYYGKSESTREQVLTRDVKGRERPERIDNGPTGIVGVNLPESDLVPVLGIGNPESKVGPGDVVFFVLCLCFDMSFPDREIQDATKIGLEKLGGQAYGEIYPGVRKAVAGDYDLWAVLDDTTVPSQLDFRRRVALSTPSRVGAPSATATELARENPNLGNISPAVREIGKDLNLRFVRIRLPFFFFFFFFFSDYSVQTSPVFGRAFRLWRKSFLRFGFSSRGVCSAQRRAIGDISANRSRGAKHCLHSEQHRRQGQGGARRFSSSRAKLAGILPVSRTSQFVGRVGHCQGI